MSFDFPFYIGLFKKNLNKYGGQANCTRFLLEPLTDITHSDLPDPKITNWIKRGYAIDEVIRSAAGTEEGRDKTYDHFRTEVKKDINVNVIERLAYEIKNVIELDEKVSPLVKGKFTVLYEKNLMDFFADTFLYVVSAHTGSVPAIPLSYSNNGNGVCVSGFGIEQKSDRAVDSLPLPVNLGIPANDIQLISSGDYKIKIAAKDDKHRFVVVADVIEDDVLSNFESFIEYLQDLRFRGRPAWVNVCRLRVYDYKNILLYDKRNALYTGKSLTAPPIYIKEYDRDLIDNIQGKIYIAPPKDTVELELCDQFGNVILDSRKYRIERERNYNNLTVFFIDDNSEKLLIRFVLTGPASPRKGRVQLEGSIKVHVKNDKDSQCNLAFYSLIKRLHDSEELTLWQGKNGDRQEFLSFPGVDQKKEDVETCNNMIEIFQKISYIEKKLHVRFDVSDFNNENVLKVLQVYTLLTAGMVSIGKGDYDVPKEYYDEYSKLIDDPSGGLVYIAFISEIEIFGLKIDLCPRYKLALWTNEVIVKEDQPIKFKAFKSIMYDIENRNVNEPELTGIDSETLNSVDWQKNQDDTESNIITD